MDYSSEIVKVAVQEVSRLPGIGKKTALRLVLHLLKGQPQTIADLSAAILDLADKVIRCTECGNISDYPLCTICTDPRRDDTTICIVEDMRDVMAIENTARYRGKYHVLNGIISPIDGIGPDKLNIAALFQRASLPEVSEVIFALPTTMEGDTTMFYLTRKLARDGLKISSIARGISVGGELQYVDEVTLGRSIAARVPYSA